ncbi:MAG: DUF2089 domain-containing protein [Tatlockia sp.]|nr:DUF2089 domain-containing protein [Tatlockia sp.]
MGKIISHCPSCENSQVEVVKMACSACGTTFEGKFTIPKLLQLSESDLEFILSFVRCSGSLKEMAKLHSISYPTLRNRLNILIETINNLEEKNQTSKQEILQELEAGKITAKQATLLLMNI